MRGILRTAMGLAAFASLVLGSAAMNVATAEAAPSGATCSGGNIAPGTYQSLTITGVCFIPEGVVTVQGGLTLAPGSFLYAASPAATVTISGGAVVGSGATLIFGCAPSFGCDITTNDRINGNVVGNAPLAMIFHGNTLNGNVSIRGGGGGATCDPNPLLTSILGFPAPAFTAFEDNHINGGESISGLQSCWFGFARNHFNGSVSLVNNTLADPDAMEILANHIHGSLACSGNSPEPKNSADVEGSDQRIPEPNTVTGKESGQCAGF